MRNQAPQNQSVDVAIVGAGILGLAHAYLAARSGKSVAVFERHPRAMGASVRNFGMIWPIGQPNGVMLETALRSRALWLEMLKEAKLPYRADGSLHVAYHADEAEVIQEFVARSPELGYDCQWLDRDATLARSPAVQPDGLLGSLWSSTEFTVDPRQIIGALPGFLEESYGVDFSFNTAVRSVTSGVVETGAGRWQAATAIICSGDDFETLYPEEFAGSGITRCKLQMLRTAPQPSGWKLGPALAAGLTLRFYPAFSVCDSLHALHALRQRIAEEMPEYDRWGIHALVSQTADGALTLGDSHENGLTVDVFNKEEIDQLILQYTSRFLRAPNLSIAQRWQGVYAKHPDKSLVVMQPQSGVRIVTATGGSGMTLSLGIAEQSLVELGLLPKGGAHA